MRRALGQQATSWTGACQGKQWAKVHFPSFPCHLQACHPISLFPCFCHLVVHAISIIISRPQISLLFATGKTWLPFPTRELLWCKGGNSYSCGAKGETLTLWCQAEEGETLVVQRGKLLWCKGGNSRGARGETIVVQGGKLLLLWCKGGNSGGAEAEGQLSPVRRAGQAPVCRRRAGLRAPVKGNKWAQVHFPSFPCHFQA